MCHITSTNEIKRSYIITQKLFPFSAYRRHFESHVFLGLLVGFVKSKTSASGEGHGLQGGPDWTMFHITRVQSDVRNNIKNYY